MNVASILFCAIVPLIAAVDGAGVSVARRGSSVIDADFFQKATNTPIGKAFQVGIPAEELISGRSVVSPSEIVDMHRFQVWGSDAQVYIDTKRTAAPSTVFLKGTTPKGESLVISSTPDGTVRGVQSSPDSMYSLHKTSTSRSLQKRAMDKSRSMSHFKCNEKQAGIKVPSETFFSWQNITASSIKRSSAGLYYAGIAIETDYEFFQKFGNAKDALNYIGNIMAYVIDLYVQEANVQLYIVYTKIWTTPSDPYKTVTETDFALVNLQNYWNANRANIARATTILFSGMQLYGGIAYVGCDQVSGCSQDILCGWYSSKKNNYGYAVAGMPFGLFDFWDYLVVAHELGHNFGSPHTHDYCGIGGAAQPIDTCGGDNCLRKVSSLPKCSAGVKSKPGTVMSYCHGLPGGLNNIEWTLGQGHRCGIKPDRVPALIGTYLDFLHARVPNCLKPPSSPAPPRSPSNSPKKASPVSVSPKPAGSPPPGKVITSPMYYEYSRISWSKYSKVALSFKACQNACTKNKLCGYFTWLYDGWYFQFDDNNDQRNCVWIDGAAKRVSRANSQVAAISGKVVR